MEQNAPQHEIGRGKLVIEPDMSALEAALKQADEMLDALKRKFGTLFDEAGEKAEKLADQIAGMVAKAAELKLEQPSPEPSPQAPAEVRERDQRIPLPDSPQADRLTDNAEEIRWREEMLEGINRLVALAEEDNNREPE